MWEDARFAFQCLWERSSGFRHADRDTADAKRAGVDRRAVRIQLQAEVHWLDDHPRSLIPEGSDIEPTSATNNTRAQREGRLVPEV